MSEREDKDTEQLRRGLRERGDRLPPKLLRLAQATFGIIEDNALSHEDCLAALPEYVDAEIAGERLVENYPLVKRHLDSCDDCSEQYAELLELTLAERAGEIPAPAAIPEPDLSFLPPLKPPVPETTPQPGQVLRVPEPVPVPALALPEFVKQMAMAVLKAISPAELPDLSGIVDPFLKQIGLLEAGSVFLGGGFAFQPGTAQALGLGAGELTMPVATLAVTYVATGKLVASLSPDQVDALAAQNALRQRAEELALLAAGDLNVESATAKKVAAQFAAVVAADPGTLRAMIEREKP